MVNWVLGDLFGTKYAHLGSSKALWEKKWAFPAKLGVYPFHDGKLEDFQKVFDQLIAKNINDGYGDEYTAEFVPVATDLEKQGDEALAAGDKTKAGELYLRSACVLRISRFPWIYRYNVTAPMKLQTWEQQLKVYMKGSQTWDEPFEDKLIPHTAAAGKDKKSIPIYVRLPVGASAEKPCPAVFLMTGLDGYRCDNTTRAHEFHKRGWASVIAEVPGTADCPADEADPESPDRLWTAVLDWMVSQKVFDMKKIVVWGLSTGGYYAARIAHTHHSRLLGSIAQGAGTHLFFSKEWLDEADNHEYPFELMPAMSAKYGYATGEEFKNESQKKFSLVDTGIVNMPCTRLLMVNGTLDGLMPIEDSYLMMNYGRAKEGRFVDGRLHMGYPEANGSVFGWLEEIMSSK